MFERYTNQELSDIITMLLLQAETANITAINIVQKVLLKHLRVFRAGQNVLSLFLLSNRVYKFVFDKSHVFIIKGIGKPRPILSAFYNVRMCAIDVSMSIDMCAM